MKTINKSIILTAAALALLAPSCSKGAFDKYPTDSMQMETYMTNDAEVQNVLYDAYYYLRTVSNNVILINSLVTDEAYCFKRVNSTDYINLNEGTWDSTLGVTRTLWSDSYSLINRANSVLANLDKVSDAHKAQFEGEAKMLRAYAYFNLVRVFAGVPLTLTPISDYRELYNYGRESVANVYAQIEKDLNDAISKLPDSYSVATEKGRATKLAAWALLGDAQLEQKNYSAAKTTLKNVIDFSKAHPTQLGLESDVTKIYDAANPMGKEIILAAQFNNGATIVANGMMRNSIPVITPATQAAYVYPDGKESSIKVTAGASGMIMTWDLWNELRKNPTDARLTKLVYAGVYDDQSISIASDEVNIKTVGTGTYAIMPTSLKYFDFGNEGLKNCSSGCDNIIYRYAGVLLMYAECLNETGSSAEALAVINEVRTRAGVAEAKGTTKAEVAAALENECLLELNMEGRRWFDLVRTGRINQIMEAHLSHRVQGLSPLNQASNNGMVVKGDASDKTGTGLKWRWTGSSDPYVFGIPYDQIQLTKWEQNKGY